MLELGLRVADGIITHGITDKYVRYVRSQVNARGRVNFDFVVSSPSCITSERDAAVKALAPECLLLAGGDYFDGWISLYDLDPTQVESLRGAVKAGDPNAASLVTRRMVDSFSIFGTEGEVTERLRLLERLGVTQVSVSVPNRLVENHEICQATEMIRRFRPVIESLSDPE